MPGRTWRGGDKYRYGYQNQEEEPEFWGGAVSYEYRIEDPRIGRFFSVDPLAASFPWNSPYAFSENCVISCVELEGLEADNAVQQGQSVDLGNGQTFISSCPEVPVSPGAGPALSGISADVLKPIFSLLGTQNPFPGDIIPIPSRIDERQFNDYMLGVSDALKSNAAFGIGHTSPSNFSDDVYRNKTFAKGQLIGSVLSAMQALSESQGGPMLTTPMGPIAPVGILIIEIHAISVLTFASVTAIEASNYLTANGNHNGGSGTEAQHLDSGGENINLESPHSSKPPGSEDMVKMRGNQGWKDKKGNIWKKDMKHKDHWDVSDSKGNKIKEVDFKGNQIWPGGPKNKNKG